MVEPESKPSSVESNVTSALRELDLNSVDKTNGNPPESVVNQADGGDENLEIVGISDDEEEKAVQRKQDSDVKTNGNRPTGQSVEKTVENEEDLEPAPPENQNDKKADGENGNTAVDVGLGTAPRKKKKSKKSKSKKARVIPTGFEEYYVDAPVTPAEFDEEKGLYDESRPFTERIEIAIQRYVARRNFDSVRKDLFDKYLAYGGIESGPKQFSGGLSATEMSNMNAAEIAAMKARHFVAADKIDDGESNFVVDFEACVAAFLSSRLPIHYDLTSHAQIKSHTTIIFNFLNYLLHHDVCPEYGSQVYTARNLCSLAEKELWQIVQAQALLPGHFNTACSEIFGGIFRGLYTTGEEEWAQGSDVNKGMSLEMARKVFKVALASNARSDIFEKYEKQSKEKTIGVSSITDVGLEVTELMPATQHVLNIYSHDLAKDLKPVGIMKAKTWYSPAAEDEDLTEEEEAAAAANDREVKEYEFWVEDHVLEKCFVGMKFETTVTELSFGVSYFDALFGVLCSFYNILPNELMYGWREPGPPLPMREKPKDSNGDKAVEAGNWGEEIGGSDGESRSDDEDDAEQENKADDEEGENVEEGE